jgi:hypothetical protein
MLQISKKEPAVMALPIITALGRLKQKDCSELEAGLCYIERPYLKKKKPKRVYVIDRL